jgi:very-short-patch-repair endonuclease
LDICESVYGIKIERQYILGSRFYDGRYGNHLLEIDGVKWHSKPDAIVRDQLKEQIAKKFGFELHRIILNKIEEVPAVLVQYKALLDEIFKDGSNSKLEISTSTK